MLAARQPQNCPKLAPKWSQDGLMRHQDVPKVPLMAPRGPKTLHNGPFAPQRAPKMAPSWPQDGPKRPQDGPKMAPRWPQDGPKRPQDAPRWTQDGPKMVLSWPLEARLRKPKNIEKTMVFQWANRLVHLGGRLGGMMGILGLMLKAPRLMLACSSKSTRPFGEPRGRFRKSAKKLIPLPGRGLACRSGPCREGG